MFRRERIVGLAAGVAMVLCLAGSASAEWQIRVVDSASSGFFRTSLALDSRGQPCISYIDDAHEQLKYAQWEGVGWNIDVVDAVGPRSGPYNGAMLSSLALTADDRPRIAYLDATNEDLKFAAWDGSSWNVQTVDSEDSVGWNCSLRLGGGDSPRIAYAVWDTGVKYAEWTGSAWEIQPVDFDYASGGGTSLALAADGTPMISYQQTRGGVIRLATWTGTQWDIQLVDGAGDVGRDTSVAIDSTGRPRIAYFRYDAGDLKFASWNGASWDVEFVDSADRVGWWPSLALDADDCPHISYYDISNGDLKYARWDGVAWDIQVVDSEGDVGWGTCLQLDADGNPWISYYDATNERVKLAFVPEPATLPVLILGGLAVLRLRRKHRK